MSTFNNIDIVCKDCGEQYEGVVWTAVHATQDPELKDLLLGGEINLLMCPKCSRVSFQEHFILYQDPAAEVVAYIYPAAQQGDEAFLRTTIMTNYKEAQKIYKPKDRKNYDPILVFGLDHFVQMMRDEEELAAQSQIAQTICDQRSIPYVMLRPSEARKLGTPRVLPTAVSSENPLHEDILTGIQTVLSANPALTLYEELHKKIEKDLDWKITTNG